MHLHFIAELTSTTDTLLYERAVMFLKYVFVYIVYSAIW